MVNSLYIHIPFCVKKCAYCDFYSVPFMADVAGDYLGALSREIEMRKSEADVLRTIYIGGGTPTLLSGKEIAGILDVIRKHYTVSDAVEVTVEANPRTITEDKAERLRLCGINRISVGVQSLHDEELAMMGRSHTATDAGDALTTLRQAGFENISVDLLYGLPGQSMRKWESTLLKILEYSPEHMSTYELTPEEGTPLHRAIQAGQIVLPGEDAVSEMYYKGIDLLERHGYVHYEISNFARSGYECRHNLNYWNRGGYVGAGAGAHSFSGGKRTANKRDVAYYIDSVNDGILPVAEMMEVGGKEAFEEFLFLGLRRSEGIDIGKIPVQQFSQMREAVEDLTSHGLLELRNCSLRLTRKGHILSNEVIVRLFREL